jgi:uncharacterized protein YkwD
MFAGREPTLRKRSNGSKIALAAGAGMTIIAAVLLVPALISLASQNGNPDIPAITILQPLRQEPEIVPRDELVQRALHVINNDRERFGMPPVKLSTNQAAQIQAEDVFKNKQISHWMSTGEKPYMIYARYGGMGSVSQNVAIAGFSKAQYDSCTTNVIYDCETIEPFSTIEELQYEMMYEDKECCNDGHRKNILNKYHTHVSIGIVYDQYYLSLVQNFENNYGLQVEASGGQTRISGQLLAGEIDQILIHYDVIPEPAVYEQNKHLLSYSPGELVAAVAKPLPPGYYYQEPDGYLLIVADEWDVSNTNIVDIGFNLAEAVGADGVYTISAMAKEYEGGETFEVASHSVFVKSESG